MASLAVSLKDLYGCCVRLFFISAFGGYIPEQKKRGHGRLAVETGIDSKLVEGAAVHSGPAHLVAPKHGSAQLEVSFTF